MMSRGNKRRGPGADLRRWYAEVVERHKPANEATQRRLSELPSARCKLQQGRRRSRTSGRRKSGSVADAEDCRMRIDCGLRYVESY